MGKVERNNVICWQCNARLKLAFGNCLLDVLLITQSSFDDLSTRLVERNVIDHVTLEHFRPNITVSGDTPPFDEVSSGDSRLNFER